MKSDAKKLDFVVDEFAKLIIANSFDKVSTYKDLALRLAVIIDSEIKENVEHEKRKQEMMGFWPESSLN